MGPLVRVPGDHPTEERPEQDLGGGHEHEEPAGRRLAQALAPDEEREPPEQGEHRHPELAGEVRPQSQSGAWGVPRAPERPSDGSQAELRVLLARCVAHDDDDHDSEHDAHERGREERRGPADAVQGGGEREGGRDGPHLAELTGQLGDQRAVPLSEPQGDDPDHADEDHRVTGADEDPGEDPELERPHHGEQELPAGHQREAGEDQLLRSRTGRAARRPAPAAPHTPTAGGR